MFIKTQSVLILNGIPLDTVYIQVYKNMEHLELQDLFIIQTGCEPGA
jgi:hypothetical protein